MRWSPSKRFRHASPQRPAHSQTAVPLQGTPIMGTGTQGGISFAPGYSESTLRAAHSQIEVPLQGTRTLGTGTRGGTSFAPGYGESTLRAEISRTIVSRAATPRIATYRNVAPDGVAQKPQRDGLTLARGNAMGAEKPQRGGFTIARGNAPGCVAIIRWPERSPQTTTTITTG